VTEEKLGLAMYKYEARMALEGKRGPLPNTPTLGKPLNKADMVNKIRQLIEIYGAVTEELIQVCTPGLRTDRLPREYVRIYKEMMR